MQKSCIRSHHKSMILGTDRVVSPTEYLMHNNYADKSESCGHVKNANDNERKSLWYRSQVVLPPCTQHYIPMIHPTVGEYPCFIQRGCRGTSTSSNRGGGTSVSSRVRVGVACFIK